MDCKGGCKMKAGGKACSKCGCDMDKMRSGGSACMKCGGKMHKSGGTVSSCMKCGGGKYTFGGKVNWSKKKVTDEYASGGMIKRADGSYSERGLWDNIRDNAGSGKKPTKQMLKQEKKIKQEMAMGGAIKSYFNGGEVDNTLINNDSEIQLGRGAFNVSEPAYDANKIMSRVLNNALSIKETEQPTTKQTGYKEEVEKNKVVKDYKSLPNLGRAKKEQQILNELIRKDIASGKLKMGLLAEDDIIGDYTLGAMREYEASGQYKRPELFKDKWLAEYKKQWNELQKTKSPAINQKEQSNNPNPNPNPLFNFFSSDWGKLSSDTKATTKATTKQKSIGWSKEQLLKEGGVEMDSKELSPKDFDTYKPIQGFTKSKKGIRATGRDRSDAYFDAVEKSQYFDLNGLKANTSIGLINDLLSKSKKVIIIPKGQDKYGRDLNDIYLQDEKNPSQYHALDSLGVVNREAIFGEYIGEESRMTDRQKMITGQAKEKGGFKYNISPSIFRKLHSQEKDKSTTTKSKQESWFPTFEELYKTPKEEANNKPKLTPAPKSKENTSIFPSFSELLNSTNNSTTNNTKKDNQPKQITKEIESDYETEQNQSYKNFGKKSAAASAKSAESKSKTNKAYVPISINPIMPTINNKNTLVKKEAPDYINNAKGQLIATDFNNQQKEKKTEERLKVINEKAEEYTKLKLKESNTIEDIKYNIKSISDYNSKIDEALQMLSGTTTTSKQGFYKMTANESIRYNPETKKREPYFEYVDDETQDRLTSVHLFLEKELDEIYKDPRYKNESAFTKKRILQKKLHESQKKMSQMQYEMKKQINDFN